MTTQDGRAVWSELTGHIVLHSEDIIGTGGEGTVFLLPAHPEYVAKIYHRDKLTDSTIRKLEVMIGYPPNAIDDKTGHLYVAWPTHTVHDTQRGSLIGFLMRKVEKTNSLYGHYVPSLRHRHTSHVHYGDLCRVAKSLATALDGLHGRGYVVGDINESNAYIADDEQVTLIDSDSF